MISELFPTVARATAQNVLFNIGRAIGGFGPIVVGAIAGTYGFALAIAMLAALYVADIAALLTPYPSVEAFNSSESINRSPHVDFA